MAYSNKKGAAVILLTILISSVILAVATNFSVISIIRRSDDSLAAFYAADAGVEKCLYEANIGVEGCGNVNEMSTNGILDNGATYEAIKISDNSLDSTGVFSGIYRKIELKR